MNIAKEIKELQIAIAGLAKDVKELDMTPEQKAEAKSDIKTMRKKIIELSSQNRNTDTIVEIVYTTYTEREIVRNAKDWAKVQEIAREEADCMGVKIVVEGDYKPVNNFTPRKVKEATKKMDKLERKNIALYEALEKVEDQIQEDFSMTLHRKAKAIEKKIDQLFDEQAEYIAARGTRYAYEQMQEDPCNSWENYRGY